MLPNKNRLKADKDFSRLFAKGRSFHARGIGMRVSLNTYGKPRVGFVVSTKVSKRAVVRNLLKRRMRDVMRPLVAKFRPQNVDVALMVRPEAVAFDFAQVKMTVLELLQKSGLTTTVPPKRP